MMLQGGIQVAEHLGECALDEGTHSDILALHRLEHPLREEVTRIRHRQRC